MTLGVPARDGDHPGDSAHLLRRDRDRPLSDLGPHDLSLIVEEHGGQVCPNSAVDDSRTRPRRRLSSPARRARRPWLRRADARAPLRWQGPRPEGGEDRVLHLAPVLETPMCSLIGSDDGLVMISGSGETRRQHVGRTCGRRDRGADGRDAAVRGIAVRAGCAPAAKSSPEGSGDRGSLATPTWCRGRSRR